jgi:hypothetical protein
MPPRRHEINDRERSQSRSGASSFTDAEAQEMQWQRSAIVEHLLRMEESG